MEQPPIPVTSVIKRKAAIEVNCTKNVAFAYIDSGATLPDWLKKCGPVNGAVKVEVNKGPYSFVGANRTVYFDNGDTIVETLASYKPPAYYSYSVTQFSDFLKYLTNLAYGQWWFKEVGGKTQVVWVYTFVPKNTFTRLILSLFATLVYKKFMKQCLQLAKGQMEKQ